MSVLQRCPSCRGVRHERVDCTLIFAYRKTALSRPRIEGNPFQADMDVSEFSILLPIMEAYFPCVPCGGLGTLGIGFFFLFRSGRKG